MIQTYRHIALIIFLIFYTNILEGQNNTRNLILELNQSIDEKIKTQEQDEYLVNMEQQQTAIISIERGSFKINEEINLLITIISPEGKIVDELNTANDASFVIFNSSTEGDYKVIIRRWNGAEAGSYKIVLDYLKDTFSSDIEQIDSLLAHFYLPNQPGAAILIQKNGSPYYKSSFGLSNLSQSISITDTTKFDIASISKQIAAFSIALLVLEEKLDLSNGIRNFIPEFPAYGADIAILHLVLNLSGIKDYNHILALSGYDEANGDNITSERVLDAIMQFEDSYFQPGTDYKYSNSGYFLIAEIIERVTGISYAQWVKENIFIPLDMHDSYIFEEGKSIKKNISNSYKKNGLYDNIKVPSSTYQRQAKNLNIYTVHTTINDYAKWMNNYRTGTVGGEQALKLIETGIHDDPNSWNWAFGFQKTKYKGINQKLSTGIIQGYRTHASYFPEKDLSILYFSNDGEWRTFYLAKKITDILLKNSIPQREIISSYTSESDNKSNDDLEEKVTIENNFDTSVAGIFSNPALSKNFSIIKTKEQLALKLFGLQEIELEPISLNEYKTSKWYMNKIIFVKDKNEVITACKVYNSRNNDFVLFNKVRE